MSYLDSAIKLIEKLNKNNFEAYIVGGYVRDFVLKNNPNDIDITTSALPSDILKLFDKVIPTGINFEGVTVILDGYSFEVTTFRKDIAYYDHRHPEVAYASSLTEDLSRRDFTINAMCLDKDLNLIDIFDGVNDLNNKIIRAVGDPKLRFYEDALRILRAFYFSAKLGFDIDDATLRGIEDNSKYLECVSGERIYNELKKLFNSKYVLKGLSYLNKSTALNYLPSLKKATNLLCEKNETLSFIEYLALGFYLEGNSLRYKLSRKELSDINIINSYVDKELDVLDIFNLSDDLLSSINNVKSVLGKDYDKDILIKKHNLPIKNIKDLDLTSYDIMNLGYKGKEIKSKQLYALRLVLLNKVLNQKDKLINIIK